MIEAYIDESAKTLLGRPLFAVAAAWGTRDQWRRFGEIWVPVLDAAGVSYYHGKDAKSDKLRRPMVSVIRATGIRGATNTAFRDEFSKSSNDLKSILGNHYAFLTLSMALHIRDWAKRLNAGPVAYVLEDGQPNVDHVIRIIQALVGDDAVSVSRAGKRDHIGLQAADFLAHQSAALDQGLVWLQQLLGDGPGQVMWGHLDPTGIEKMSTGMSQLLRRYRQQKARRTRERKVCKAIPGD